MYLNRIPGAFCARTSNAPAMARNVVACRSGDIVRVEVSPRICVVVWSAFDDSVGVIHRRDVSVALRRRGGDERGQPSDWKLRRIGEIEMPNEKALQTLAAHGIARITETVRMLARS